MMRTLPLFLLAGLLAACTATSQSQSVYGVESAYAVAAKAEAAFLASGTAAPGTVTKVRQLDNTAYAALVQLRAAAQAGTVVDTAKLVAAQAAVTALSDYLTQTAVPAAAAAPASAAPTTGAQ